MLHMFLHPFFKNIVCRSVALVKKKKLWAILDFFTQTGLFSILYPTLCIKKKFVINNPLSLRQIYRVDELDKLVKHLVKLDKLQYCRFLTCFMQKIMNQQKNKITLLCAGGVKIV